MIRAFSSAPGCRAVSIRLVFPMMLPVAAFSGCASLGEPEAPEPSTSLQRPMVAVTEARGSFERAICEPGGCVRRLTSDQTGPATETMVAIDFTDPRVVVAVAKDFRLDATACVAAIAYVSHDAGLTWRESYPRDPDPATGRPSTERCESDPVAAFDGRGNALIETLELSNVDALFVYRSRDRGVTWSPAANAFDGRNDKNWLATDWRTGRIYSNTGYTCDGGQAVMYTDDSGDFWSTPACTPRISLAQIEVDSAARIHMAGLIDDAVGYLRSDNAGLTWTRPVLLGPARTGESTPLGRASPFVDIAVAYSTGDVHVAWNSYEDSVSSVWLASSSDGGESWAEPINLGRGMPSGNRFLPAVAASPAGDLHVIFYDDRADPAHAGLVLDVMYLHGVVQTTGRVAFDPGLRLTPTSFASHPANDVWPFFPGHYVGLAATNQRAVATFAATYNQRPEIFAAVVGS